MTETIKPSNPALALFSVEELLNEAFSRRIVSGICSVELDQATDEDCKRGQTNILTFVQGDWEELTEHNESMAKAVSEYLDEELEASDD